MSIQNEDIGATLGDNKGEYELFQPFALPRNKLDADQYSAEDLDGVTESLFGSGNLNFLVLQSGISGNLLPDGGAFNPYGDISPDVVSLSNIYSGADQAQNSFSNLYNMDIPGASEALAGGLNDSGSQTLQSGGNSSSLNSAALSDLAVNGNGENPVSSSAFNFGDDGLNGSDGVTSTITTERDGQNGADGNDGQDGMDGNGGDKCYSCDGPIINIEGPIIDMDFDDAIGDSLTFITDTIDQVFNFIGDIQIVDILTVVSDLTLNIVKEITDLIDNGLDLSTLLTINLDAVVGEITDFDLDIETVNDVMTGLEKTIDLTDLTDAVDTIVNLGDFSPLALNTYLDLLSPQDSANDDMDLSLLTDVSVAGIDVPVVDLDVNLDPVENIVGDIDLDVSIVEDLDLLNTGGGEDTDLALNTDIIEGAPDLDIVINPVEDVIGDIDIAGDLDINLLENSETDNGSGDQDVTLNTDIDLVDDTLTNGVLDVELDAVEQVTGDIDLDLTAATDVLGDSADPLVDSFDGGSGQDGLLSGLGDIVEDTADYILPDVDDTTDDTDLVLDLGGDVTEDIGAVVDQDVTLDTVEEIIHDTDIDVTLDAALDLLDSSDGSHDILDSEDIESWTETTLVDADNVFAYGSGEDSGLDELLPESGGHVGEGLGGLDIDTSGDTGLLGGGLFG